jgi:hypothetical protein
MIPRPVHVFSPTLQGLALVHPELALALAALIFQPAPEFQTFYTLLLN